MLRTFLDWGRDETGAITVDWVVLTASVCGLMLGVLITFNTGIHNHAELTSTTLQETGIPDF